MPRHWGVTRLGAHEYGDSIEEMKHADALIERILFLGGHPNLQRLNPVLIGQSVLEVLHCDQKLESKAIANLREAIAHCESVRDVVSRDLFPTILHDEEKHAGVVDTQFDLIEIERCTMLNSAAAPDQGHRAPPSRRAARRRPPPAPGPRPAAASPASTPPPAAGPPPR